MMMMMTQVNTRSFDETLQLTHSHTQSHTYPGTHSHSLSLTLYRIKKLYEGPQTGMSRSVRTRIDYVKFSRRNIVINNRNNSSLIPILLVYFFLMSIECSI